MVYALALLQWLLRTVSAYSEPESAYPGKTFLAYAGQSIRVISSLSSSSSTARVRCGRALSSIKMKSGPMAPRNRRTWGRSTSSQ
ncbi:hypothetical protein TNCV_2418511 [Trichonephila clavipes]|nr:hypothetical protein TNCV_2418511 [Trichonephila clavipes]